MKKFIFLVFFIAFLSTAFAENQNNELNIITKRVRY